jgi:hypothetical protein
MKKEENPRTKWWFEQAQKVFQAKLLSELYGPYLFKLHKLEPPNVCYSLPLAKDGGAVWLVQEDSDEPCVVLRMSEAEKRSEIPRPRICAFTSTVPVPMRMLAAAGTRVDELKEKVLEGAESLARTVNQAVVDVLLAAAERRIAAQNRSLRHLLAEASDSLAGLGLTADRFVFPGNLQHRMTTHGIVVRDLKIRSSHFTGHTETGLRACWSGELPDSTALVIASSSGIGLTLEPRYSQPESVGWPTHLSATYYFNPIVQNTCSLVRLDGVSEAEEFAPPSVAVQPSGAPSATRTPASELLQADLDRLHIRKRLRNIIELLLSDAERAYQAEAHIASVLLYRSVIEAILLGLLCKRRSKAEDASPQAKAVPKDRKGQPKRVEAWKLEEMIRRAVEMGLLDDTDESSIRTLQEYGNLVHPARILRKSPYMSPPEDANIVRGHLVKLLKRYGALP